ncbi:MAG: flavin reductase family protein [Gemmatimonadaceae bacterium]
MSAGSRAQFRAALSRFASGVTVVTVRGADGADHGMTLSAFSSLSLDPPLVLACIDSTAAILPHLREAETFGISVLAAGQQAISRRFADQTVDRFAGVGVARAASGVALIDGAVAQLECRRVVLHPGGDHVIAVGEVLHASAFMEEPLVYFHRDYGRFERLPGDGGRRTGEF